ncbi:MAG TPA: gamma-glutamyltransferase, partial [Gemmatimonadaceae bacterium]|nr:gamma-glutamyltransferase [Gemmatimonadaceae bacterium]
MAHLGLMRRATAVAAAAAAACAPAPHGGADGIPAAWHEAHRAALVTADSAMVVSGAPLATRAGVQVLRAGGNAVDAAVAVAFTLAVVYPTAGNLGGGGFIVARLGTESVALDFRETAPGKASRDMFLDARGNVTGRSTIGALAAGVPGSVAGLWAMHEKYGRLPWRDLLAPAIALADSGFAADSAFLEDAADEAPRLSKFPSTAALLLPHGAPVPYGARWRNPDLAATLRRIAEQGRDGFYTGRTAELIVAEMRRGGGIISLQDLKDYRAEWREPVEFTYRGHRVIAMPPASSGGLTVALMANVLGGIDLRAMGFHSERAIAAIAGAERAAFLRRNTLLGDPAFVRIDAAAFLSPDSAAAIRAAIVRAESDRRHTTHFSIVDAQGNAVAMTTTLNDGYGSAEAVAGAGFLLNDEMDDFTTKPGAVNNMGLRQWEANAIQPG